MWSAERSRACAAFAIALGLLAGACNVRPLYGTTPAGTQVDAELAAINVLPASGRVGQLVHNELVFLLSGGAQEGAEYELKLDASATASDPIVRLVGGEPQNRFINFRTDFKLFRTGTEEPILQGAVTRQATYEWTNQRFANDRAEIDARARAAGEVAEEIRLRLGIFFASDQKTGSQSSPSLVQRPRNSLTGLDDPTARAVSTTEASTESTAAEPATAPE